MLLHSVISNVDKRMQELKVPLYPYHDILNYTNNLIFFSTYSDLSPVPANSAVQSYITSCCAQNLSSHTLNKSTDCTSTTQLGKLFQISTIRAEKKCFLKLWINVWLCNLNLLPFSYWSLIEVWCRCDFFVINIIHHLKNLNRVTTQSSVFKCMQL